MTLKQWVQDIGTATPLEIHEYAWIIAGIFTLASVAVSFYIIGMHIKIWNNPQLQRSMSRIVLMVPVYVIGSYCSLVWKDHAFYFSLIRDCYEAYVLFMFFKMLIELADGEENLIAKLDYEKQIRCFFPLCCCHIKPGRIFLHRCKQMILQFVILKPALALITFALAFYDIYEEGNFSYKYGYLYVTIVYNVSFTISLYFLVLFYESIKHILAKYRPLAKFMCIKAVVFFSYWQSIVIAICVHFGWFSFVEPDAAEAEDSEDEWSISDVAMGLQNFLICIEMLPLAVAHIKSFGHKSYGEENTIIDPNALTDEHKMNVIQRIIYIMNLGDLFKDTFEALKKGPKRNVQSFGFMELSDEEKKKRVVKEGWLYKRGEDLAKIWKSRYCLLLENPKGLIYFKKNIFEEDILKKLKLDKIKIDKLNFDITKISPIKARGFVDFNEFVAVTTNKKNANRFTIATTPRKWHFKAKTVQERNEWMDAVEKLGKVAHPQDGTFMQIPLENSISNSDGMVQLDEIENV